MRNKSYMMANTNLYTQSTSSGLKLLQYNVDQAVREEAFEKTKWVNRSCRVKALIKEVDADIVCLQEFRLLPGVDEMPEQFLASFRYRFVIDYRNASPMAFGQAILYDPKKFYALKTVKKWLSATPDVISDICGHGSIVSGVQFCRVHDGKVISDAAPFWVFNTHFGLQEELKTQSCHVILKIVEELVPEDQCALICGDFNFFPDRDGNKQREILTAKWTDFGNAVTLSGKPLEGTFVGYEHDEFKADLNNMVSRLDHVFGCGHIGTFTLAKNPVLYTKTMLEVEPEELTTRDYPSDHLPLVVEFN